MADPHRILLIRPSALGDVCRTVPVAATLRRRFPNATIDWVVQDAFAPAIRAHPAVSEVIEFPRRRFSRWWRNPKVAMELLRWLRDLRRRQYDLVFDVQGLGRSGLMALCSGAPRRVGLRGRELGWLGSNVRYPPPANAHTVDVMLSLLVQEGIEPIHDMRLYVEPEDREWWRTERTRRGITGDYAVLAPSSRWRSKQWPARCWRALIEPLRERGLEHVVFTGGPGEEEQVAPALPEPPRPEAIDLVGRTSIAQTMAMIAESSIVIANDSAPLHMAVGFGRPCIGLYGPTDPAIVGPWGHEESVVRADPGPGSISFKDDRIGETIMARIAVESVVERLDAVLARAMHQVGGGAP